MWIFLNLQEQDWKFTVAAKASINENSFSLAWPKTPSTATWICSSWVWHCWKRICEWGTICHCIFVCGCSIQFFVDTLSIFLSLLFQFGLEFSNFLLLLFQFVTVFFVVVCLLLLIVEREIFAGWVIDWDEICWERFVTAFWVICRDEICCCYWLMRERFAGCLLFVFEEEERMDRGLLVFFAEEERRMR